jgi:hypothetical protein
MPLITAETQVACATCIATHGEYKMQGYKITNYHTHYNLYHGENSIPWIANRSGFACVGTHVENPKRKASQLAGDDDEEEETTGSGRGAAAAKSATLGNLVELVAALQSQMTKQNEAMAQMQERLDDNHRLLCVQTRQLDAMSRGVDRLQTATIAFGSQPREDGRAKRARTQQEDRYDLI